MEAVLVLLVESAALYCGVWVRPCHLPLATALSNSLHDFGGEDIVHRQSGGAPNGKHLDICPSIQRSHATSVGPDGGTQLTSFSVFPVCGFALIASHILSLCPTGVISNRNYRACGASKDYLGHDSVRTNDAHKSHGIRDAWSSTKHCLFVDKL